MSMNKRLVLFALLAPIATHAADSTSLQVLSPQTRDFFRDLYTQPENTALLAIHLSHGADIKGRVGMGTALHTLLYGAANTGKLHIPRATLILLLTKGADPEESDNEGRPLLSHLLEVQNQTQGHFSDDIAFIQQWIAQRKNLIDLSRLSLQG